MSSPSSSRPQTLNRQTEREFPAERRRRPEASTVNTTRSRSASISGSCEQKEKKEPVVCLERRLLRSNSPEGEDYIYIFLLFLFERDKRSDQLQKNTRNTRINTTSLPLIVIGCRRSSSITVCFLWCDGEDTESPGLVYPSMPCSNQRLSVHHQSEYPVKTSST